MAYYYVKKGGTATGDAGRYSSQQVGSFAALGVTGYYDTITLAINATTSPITGDFVNFSDLHTHTGSVSISYTGLTSNTYYLVCVDDANIDAGRTTGNRGSEENTGATDITFSNAFASGLHAISADNIVFLGNNILYDSMLEVTGGNDEAIVFGTDGSSLNLVGCVINCSGTASNQRPINASSGGVINMTGGSVITGATGLLTLSNAGFANGGGTIKLKGVDISVVTGTLIATIGSSNVSDDTIEVHLDMCKIATGVAFTNETFKSYNQRALFTRCSDSITAAEYQYALCCFGGGADSGGGVGVQDDDSIFRNEDEPFTESNQKISYKIVTNSDASLGSPLWFEFPVLRYSRLSTGATDTLQFYIASNTALTDKDIYIEISYPDGTNKQTPNFLSSSPTTVGGTLDLMATGTTLTTDGSSSWTNAPSNLYQIDIDTSSDVGSDCQPIVKVYVTKPSVTIQIASEFGLN